LRRLGHGGSGVDTLTPGTTGRMRLDGMDVAKVSETLPLGFGTVWPKLNGPINFRARPGSTA